jgi:hypothetical protein
VGDWACGRALLAKLNKLLLCASRGWRHMERVGSRVYFASAFFWLYFVDFTRNQKGESRGFSFSNPSEWPMLRSLADS